MATRSDGTGPALFVGGLVVAGGLLAYFGRRSTSPTRTAPHTSDRASKLSALEPTTREMYQQLEVELGRQGIQLQLGRTVSTVEQEKEYARQGKSSIASGITWHLIGRALDAYPFDPVTRAPDMKGKRIDLYRAMHRIWARLGGIGLAFDNYPEGPVRVLQTGDGRKYVDLGHLEYRRPYATLAQAYAAEGKSRGVV